ncbi:hypothetical protein [Polaribacter sp. HaHaR_3_91]|uniref:hypothetical protein n=1 Tax=Polaribacter sp. HaHaR_3_91 TaxID=2745561 RepID=UPI001C4FD900|nr:hypothetical protein [Polaribacter sp. HaHaR_3_91]QXP63234.1 hypothetical protein H0I27_15500 [Polaribacter sp. HaHaR_3_91]
MENIKDLPKNTEFISTHCPDKALAVPFSKIETDGSLTKLHKLVKEFQKSLLDLSSPDRKTYLKIFEDTNQVNKLFKRPSKAIRKDDYPGKTGDTTHKLLVEMFTNTFGLTAFDIKGHYKKLYDSKKDSWCPFCGMEKYKVPERIKQDYDHLLSKKDYPAAAVNLNNLIPMGIDCNRIYKKDDDILFDKKNNKRRTAVHPYSETIKPILTLKGSKVGVDKNARTWKVSFTPKNQKVATWNDLFNISDRCREDFLEKRPKSSQETEYDTFLEMLIKLCRREKSRYEIRSSTIGDWTEVNLDTYLEDNIDVLKDYYYKDRNMLKSAIYDFLKDHSDSDYKETLLDRINVNLKRGIS